MLRYHIVFILWSLNITIAENPPDHMTQSIDNDKIHIKYPYVYPYANDDVVHRKKIEMNSDKMDNGIIISTNVERDVSPDRQSLDSLRRSIANNTLVYNQSRSRINFISNAIKIGFINDTVHQRQNSNNTTVEHNSAMKLLNLDKLTHQDEAEVIHYPLDYLDSAGIVDIHKIITENILTKKSDEMFSQHQEKNITQPLHTTYKIDSELSHINLTFSNESDQRLRHNKPNYNYKEALLTYREYLGLDGRINPLYNTPNVQAFDGDTINSQIELPGMINHKSMRQLDLSNDKMFDSKPTTLSEIILTKPNNNLKLLRPIVVAEILNTDQQNYSTIFPYSFPSVVNSDEMDPIIGKINPTLELTVNSMKIADNASIDVKPLSTNIESNETSQLSNIPLIINSKIDKSGMAMNSTPHSTSSIDGKSIEFQKSYELYHSAPIQEIHYPAQFISRVTSIDQPQRQAPCQSTQKKKISTQALQQNVRLFRKNEGDKNNIFIKTKFEPELYPPRRSRNLYRTNEPPEATDFQNKKFHNHDTLIIKTGGHPCKQYISQKLFMDNTVSRNMITRVQADNLNFRDTHLYQLNSFNGIKLEINPRMANRPNITIVASQEQFPILNSIGQQFNDYTNIIENPISLGQTQVKTKNAAISHMDNSTINIHTSDMNNRINYNTDNERPLNDRFEKFYHHPIDDEKFAETSSHPVFSEEFVANKMQYVPQRYLFTPNGKAMHEKKKMIPDTLYKFIPDTYPIQSLQSYRIENFTNIPITTHKDIIAKQTAIPYKSTFKVDIPLKSSYPLRLSRYTEKSFKLPHNTHYVSNYYNNMDQHKHKFDAKHIAVNPLNSRFFTNIAGQSEHGYIHIDPMIPSVSSSTAHGEQYSPMNQLTDSKKYYHTTQSRNYQYPFKEIYSGQSELRTLTTNNINQLKSLLWRVTHRNDRRPIKEEEMALHPMIIYHMNPAHRETYRYSPSAKATDTSDLKKWKWQGNNSHNFRQSKMEYGFKPPIIPSTRYDEQMAMEVEC